MYKDLQQTSTFYMPYLQKVLYQEKIKELWPKIKEQEVVIQKLLYESIRLYKTNTE
jgi:hypothetical protein